MLRKFLLLVALTISYQLSAQLPEQLQQLMAQRPARTYGEYYSFDFLNPIAPGGWISGLYGSAHMPEPLKLDASDYRRYLTMGYNAHAPRQGRFQIVQPWWCIVLIAGSASSVGTQSLWGRLRSRQVRGRSMS